MDAKSISGVFAISCGSRTYKPNSVRRICSGWTAIPLGRALLRGSSDLPEGLTHRAGTCRSRSRNFLPIWSCSVWGLPCPLHCCLGGALLPHLFTLTLIREDLGGMFSVALSVERT
jgi:hypothetical protein